MPADVCLLLVQSLSGECNAAVPDVDNLAALIETQAEPDAADVGTIASDAIAPSEPTATPQFGEPEPCKTVDTSAALPLCTASDATHRQDAVHPDVEPTAAFASDGAASVDSNALQTSPISLSGVSAPRATPTEVTSSVTEPVALNIPPRRRAAPIADIQAPRFSTPARTSTLSSISEDVTALALRTAATRQRPASGAQLYRQRQLALQSGRLYTRLSPSQYADQWRQATRQPTYEDWRRLLSQEARAVAGGQGHNRLEVVVGDSFGLWLPSDTLPRDRLWLNQSISGDTTAGILQRLSAFASTRPTTIHLLAGANDLKNGVPEAQIVRNLQQTVQQLRRQHPQAHIVVYSVLPTRRADIGNDRVRSLNAHIAAITQRSAVEYRDVHPFFQDRDGHLRPDLTTDGLHLNALGYALWQQAILARVR